MLVGVLSVIVDFVMKKKVIVRLKGVMFLMIRCIVSIVGIRIGGL